MSAIRELRSLRVGRLTARVEYQYMSCNENLVGMAGGSAATVQKQKL